MLIPPIAPGVLTPRVVNPRLAGTLSRVAAQRKLVAAFYAYSFWRGGAPGEGLNPSGQYGGGQSGLIATFGFAERTHKDATPRLALLFRTAIAHDNLRDRELAVGIRWQTKTRWPVSLSVERRFRQAGGDSFALYVAGGRGDIRLPAKFRLESYAQAGIVSGSEQGYFFDAQARADRRILPRSPLPIHIGAGVWTGGQRGTERLDIGPSLRTELPIGPARIRISADWRFRVAGNASPANGPALTLSTGF